MFVRKLSLRNFKAYRQAEVDLPQTGLVLIVGPNNSGKSALLSVLDAVNGNEDLGELQHAAASEPMQVVVEFEPTRAERMALLSDAPKWVDTTVLSRLRITYVADYARLKPTLVEGIDADEKWTEWEPEQSRYGVNEGALRQLPHANWGRSLFHYAATRPGTSRERALVTSTRLDPTGENLPETLLFLNANAEASWSQLRHVVADIMPDVGTLRTPIIRNQVRVAFDDPHLNTRHNVKDLGTGVEQVVMTAYACVDGSPWATVIVEEPEAHLHPEAQRRLLYHLLQWSQHRLILVSTHSTVFLDAANEGVPILLTRRDHGVSTIREASSELPQALDAVGVRLSDVLSVEKAIIVEGPSDQQILSHWFGSVAWAQRWAIVASHRGGDGAWIAEAFDTWIASLDALPRSLVFLRDRDELDDDAIERLQRNGRVVVLERREIENYFLDQPEAVSRALNERLGHEATHASDVVDALREEADALRPVVLIKRVAQQIRPIYPLNRRIVAELVDANAGLAELSDAVRRRLPPADYLENVGTTWERVAQDLEREWEERWRDFVPGADVLQRLWKRWDLAYQKRRDGLLLARHSTPPAALRRVLDEIMGD